MIEVIKLKGFKRFEDNEFELKNITLLTGMNGAGKSSLIQGLLLANEVATSYSSVSLDNSFGVDLGTASEVINWNSRRFSRQLSPKLLSRFFMLLWI